MSAALSDCASERTLVNDRIHLLRDDVIRLNSRWECRSRVKRCTLTNCSLLGIAATTHEFGYELPLTTN